MKKIVMKVLIILAVIIAAVAVLGVAAVLTVGHDFSGEPPVSTAACTNPHIAQDGNTRVSAHRSGGGIAPENTLMAFKNCLENNDFTIDVFEFDLHITKDKELVLLHDGTLSRTSDSVETLGREDARPSEYTYEELRQLNMGENFTTDAGEAPFKGLRGDEVPEDLRILNVRDLFDYLAQFGEYDYIIEIKDSEDLGREACDKLYEILTEYGLLKRAIVGTFHGEVSAYMDEAHPDMLRSASMKEVIGFYADSLFNVKRPEGHYKFVSLQIPYEQYGVRLGTTRMINYAHKHNIAVQYWTINEEDRTKELASKGADAIMSDVPDMVYRVLYEETAQTK